MEYKMISSFQDRLIELLDLTKLSQKEFSDKLDVSRTIIHRYIHRGDNPRADRIIKIANTFNVSPLWLMGCDVSINSTVTPKDVVHNIPLLEDIFVDNLFSIKNYKGIISNIIDLDVNFQYFYYDMEDKQILVQIKSKYEMNDVVVFTVDKEIKFSTLKDIKNNCYKIIGKLVCISFKN